MKEVNNKEDSFLRKWENRRRNKWRYILINGCIYYGLSAAVVSFLIHSGFKSENMQLSWFIRYAFIFMGSGIFVVLRQYNQTEKIYLNLTDKFEIIEGVRTLKSVGIWNFENLKISKENEDRITVQNNLFWPDDIHPSPELIKQCYATVYDDFKRLKKNPDFDNYIKTKK